MLAGSREPEPDPDPVPHKFLMWVILRHIYSTVIHLTRILFFTLKEQCHEVFDRTGTFYHENVRLGCSR
jgi:hypothetical protein